MKSRDHLAVWRRYGRVCREILPDKRNRHITCRVFRLTLVEVHLCDLERLALGLDDGLEIHFVAGQEKHRDIEGIWRISGIDICLERLQIAVTPFLQEQLEFSGILKNSRLAGSRPINRKRARQFVFVAGSMEQRLKRGRIRNSRGQLSAVTIWRAKIDGSMGAGKIVFVQTGREIV